MPLSDHPKPAPGFCQTLPKPRGVWHPVVVYMDICSWLQLARDSCIPCRQRTAFINFHPEHEAPVHTKEHESGIMQGLFFEGIY